MGASSVTRRNQLRREAQPRVSFALERSSLAFVIGGVSNRFVLGTICVATLFALNLVPVWAQDATWAPPSPGSSVDFNNPVNWTPIPPSPSGVPTGTAFFGSVVDPDAKLVEIFSTPALTQLTQFVFHTDAANYSIDVFSGATLQFSGGGVQNLSSPSVVQDIVVTSGGTINLTNGSTAGPNTVGYRNEGGTIVFSGGSTAGAAEFENQGTPVWPTNGTITFMDSSNAGTAVISNNDGAATVTFEGASSADSARITNDSTGGHIIFTDMSNAGVSTAFIGNEAPGNTITFESSSTAGSATISNVAGSTIEFLDTASAAQATITNAGSLNFIGSAGIAATAGDATITNSGTVEFHNASTAGSATITTTTPFGVTNFHDTSNAGTATLTVGGEGVMNFFDQSSADAASIHVDGTSSVNFHDGTTAGTAKIIAGDMGSTDDFTGGFIFFEGNSTADHATITALGDSNIEFDDEPRR